MKLLYPFYCVDFIFKLFQVGTIAGNLMIKHQYHEFPSDMFLILETVGARLEIARGTGRNDSQTVTLEEFLNINMDKKVILKVILPARNSDSFLLRTYKVNRNNNVTGIVYN